MSRWLCYMVSVECNGDKGAYQGEIVAATNSKITLCKAFCDGIPCESPNVVIWASDIADLKLIEKQSGCTERSTVTMDKPSAKRAGRTLSMSDSLNGNKSGPQSQNHCAKSKPIDIKSKPIDIETKLNQSDLHKTGTPSKKDRSKGKWSRGWRDEACFGSPLDDTINKDFDFEKNLALFDKQAVWDEINNSLKPDVVRHTDQGRKNTKYRHDENVIASMPTTFRQIIVPKQEVYEYVTDDGLIVPSISRLLRTRLFSAAQRLGITWERRNELMGRAATEMALQLIGGGHRLNPHNTHQTPTVVFLCGPHRQGAMGINAARQLSSHGVRTIVFTTSTEPSYIEEELSLYKLTRNKVITKTSELPNIADLIVVALCEEADDVKLYGSLANWTKTNRAPVLALDPPALGTPGISTKYSLVPVLPLALSPENGKVYLCNLSFPIEVFNELRITYKSPFGSKFIIPLHPNEEI